MGKAVALVCGVCAIIVVFFVCVRGPDGSTAGASKGGSEHPATLNGALERFGVKVPASATRLDVTIKAPGAEGPQGDGTTLALRFGLKSGHAATDFDCWRLVRSQFPCAANVEEIAGKDTQTRRLAKKPDKPVTFNEALRRLGARTLTDATGAEVYATCPEVCDDGEVRPRRRLLVSFTLKEGKGPQDFDCWRVRTPQDFESWGHGQAGGGDGAAPEEGVD